MTDLKNLKKLNLRLPANFEQSVWKAIYTRMPQKTQANWGSSWGDLLWTQPAWLSGLVCAVLLVGMALGQFQASVDNGSDQGGSDAYVSSLSMGENL